jgi:hypothetical protein
MMDFVAFEEAEALAEVGGEFDGSGLGEAGGGHWVSSPNKRISGS